MTSKHHFFFPSNQRNTHFYSGGLFRHRCCASEGCGPAKCDGRFYCFSPLKQCVYFSMCPAKVWLDFTGRERGETLPRGLKISVAPTHSPFRAAWLTTLTAHVSIVFTVRPSVARVEPSQVPPQSVPELTTDTQTVEPSLLLLFKVHIYIHYASCLYANWCFTTTPSQTPN